MSQKEEQTIPFHGSREDFRNILKEENIQLVPKADWIENRKEIGGAFPGFGARFYFGKHYVVFSTKDRKYFPKGKLREDIEEEGKKSIAKLSDRFSSFSKEPCKKCENSRGGRTEKEGEGGKARKKRRHSSSQKGSEEEEGNEKVVESGAKRTPKEVCQQQRRWLKKKQNLMVFTKRTKSCLLWRAG